VEFDAPLSVLFAGALVGALMVGMLRQWSILQRYYDAGNLRVWRLVVELGAFVGLRIPVGLCMAAIAIVLGRISLDFQGVLQVKLFEDLADHCQRSPLFPPRRGGHRSDRESAQRHKQGRGNPGLGLTVREEIVRPHPHQALEGGGTET